MRIYNFEHELRNILLKYILLIEENIKRIFITVLNDTPNIDDNYLVDLSSYDTSIAKRKYSNAIKTIQKVLELYNSKKSQPISRKRNQDINVPYWILINEMSLNTVINTIKNLNVNIKNQIILECFKEFTLCEVPDNCDNLSANMLKRYRKELKAFINVLTYIGDFRNKLAHNQPIYCFNVKEIETNVSTGNLKINYCEPYINKKDPKNSLISCECAQQKINCSLLGNLAVFYGKDNYNTFNYKRNFNLSFIIYLIYKINKALNDKCLFKQEIYNLFYKYNVILDDNIETYKIGNNMDTLVQLINNDDILNKTYNEMTSSKKMIHIINTYVNYIKRLKSSFNRNIKKAKVERIYNETFANNDIYTLITGIDKSYFDDIN